ncbi:MAG TPA: hypothetical protein VH092_34165 [Urbifossiella sp.]|nr:hypothetical protein [Urbifossiella sp.]
MNGRRPRSTTPRPQTSSPANLALRSSTASWYAEWKARKQAAPAPTPLNNDAAEAVAKWLTGNEK